MCGRFVAATPPSVLADELLVDEVVLPDGELPLRWNVAPTADVYGVADGRDGRRRLGVFRWGFPGTAADGRELLLFNARSETLAEKPTFRDAFRSRRCLVPSDGFYEWRDRRPFHVRRRDGRPMVFAGLWQRFGDTRACTIVTTSANATLAAVHDRMPVILDGPEEWADWLDRAAHDTDALRHLLRPSPDDTVELVAVGPAVGNVRNDGPELLTPADPAPEQQQLI